MTDTKINGLDPEQQQAYNWAIEGKNIFLTGDAGTGKSYTLNTIIDALRLDKTRAVLVSAPTGIAALNIDGVTVHSLLKIRPDTNLFDTPSASVVGHLRNIFRRKTTLIIDEVSMLRADLFDYLISAIRLLEIKNPDYHVQLILSGDFYQLPPVVTKEDYDMLETRYPHKYPYYAFNGNYWSALDLENAVLRETHRQKSDSQLARALDAIRTNSPYKADAINFINQQTASKPLDTAITICGKNLTATQFNSQSLRQIDNPLHTFKAYAVKFAKSSRPAPDLLELKTAARVMMLTNGVTDDGDEYYNGDLGTVISINARSANTYQQGDVEIEVELDRGPIVSVNWHEWNAYEYVKSGKKLKKQAKGSFFQIPLKLAYAITVHKSQGQTFDAVNFYPEIFATGQLYVALSRVRSIKNLYLYQKITPDQAHGNPQVANFYRSLEGQHGVSGYDPVLGAYIDQKRYKVLKFLANLPDNEFEKYYSALADVAKK